MAFCGMASPEAAWRLPFRLACLKNRMDIGSQPAVSRAAIGRCYAAIICSRAAFVIAKAEEAAVRMQFLPSALAR